MVEVPDNIQINSHVPFYYKCLTLDRDIAQLCEIIKTQCYNYSCNNLTY